MNYSTKLKDPRWQKKRLEVFSRDGFKCLACQSAEKTLHLHHLIYSKGEPWDSPSDNFETLCDECHEWRERFNDFWGRSVSPTRFCKYFDAFFQPLFFDNRDFSILSKHNSILEAFATCYSIHHGKKIKIEFKEVTVSEDVPATTTENVSCP